ncbi:MAG TPA: HD domain-containing protein [Microthrixaceae bacterium]|nr:HD domain-containing protein [Microthrixaceae bacterium]
MTGTASSRRFRPLHWAGRFGRSLRPGAPSAASQAWARGWLTDPEQVLFLLMSHPDQHHSIGVARQVEAALDETGTELDDEQRRAVVAAALLHDVGKTMAGLRTSGRVVATLSGAVGGKDLAEHWQDTSGFTRKVGLYLRYPTLGAEMLEVAGSHPWVIAWAAEHHEPEEAWTVPVEVGRVLADADS